MARRNEPEDGAPPSFNSPFRDLAKRVGPLPSAPPARGRVPAPTPKPSPRAQPARQHVPEVNDEALFQAAVRGVVPIPADQRGRAVDRPRAGGAPGIVREEAAALAALADLVAGIAAFDISDTDEHVEGMVVGLDPRLLRRLRAGEFAYQAHLDLHGMTADEAKRAVQEFLLRSMVAGHRCVLLVHGRGRNSPDQRSVLKDRLKQWLTHGELGRRVLAFCTARPYDGGSGATYVLLRRDRHAKKPFRTLDGAKS